jgi:hypothetical protein
MVSVSNERALAEYQRRVGSLFNELVMRDVAITELEERLAAAEAEAAALRAERAPDAELWSPESAPARG